MPTDGMACNALEDPLLRRLDRESWREHKAVLDTDWIVAFLRVKHPLRLDYGSQFLYTTLMLAWLQYAWLRYEGPFPSPPLPRASCNV